MAEIGLISSIIQIADIGLRLSLRLYAFGETVSSADKSVIANSKDVSLASSVLKELGQILGKDQEESKSLCSKNPVQRADGTIKNCLRVFKEVDDIVVKRCPHLSQGDKARRATLILERMKWPLVQPRLQLLQSNLDKLKTTLLLMINVFIYARQASERYTDERRANGRYCSSSALLIIEQDWISQPQQRKPRSEGLEAADPRPYSLQ